MINKNTKKNNFKKYSFAILFSVGILFMSQCGTQSNTNSSQRDFLQTYTRIAEAVLQDSIFEARAFQNLSSGLTAGSVTQQQLAALRNQWTVMRRPYLQIEATRFSNTPIDQRLLVSAVGSVTLPRGGSESVEMEGRLNAWPLAETTIDADIRNASNADAITKVYVLSNNGAANSNGDSSDGSEEDVTIGYHALEYILWGTDDNSKTGGPATPHNAAWFNSGGSVGTSNSSKRIKYLQVAAELLVEDLNVILGAWRAQPFRNNFESNSGNRVKNNILGSTGTISTVGGRIAFNPDTDNANGIAQFIFHEFGGERLNGLRTGDNEDEHSCFSDTTMQDFYYDMQGVINLYLGSYSYTRSNSQTTSVSGTGIKDLVSRNTLGSIFSSDEITEIRSLFPNFSASTTIQAFLEAGRDQFLPGNNGVGLGNTDTSTQIGFAYEQLLGNVSSYNSAFSSTAIPTPAQLARQPQEIQRVARYRNVQLNGLIKAARIFQRIGDAL